MWFQNFRNFPWSPKYFAKDCRFTSLFHHQVTIFELCFFVLPHISAVEERSAYFICFHIFSVEFVSSWSALIFSAKIYLNSLWTTGSFSFQQRGLDWKIFFDILGNLSFNSHTSSLCCGTHSSLGITFTSLIDLKRSFLTMIKSIWVLVTPEW